MVPPAPQEDIRIDSRGRGASFLRQHPMHAAELVACTAVHHSRAAAVEGHFRLFETQSAAAAAAADAGADAPAMFSVCSWEPTTGAVLRNKRVQAARCSDGLGPPVKVPSGSASRPRFDSFA